MFNVLFITKAMIRLCGAQADLRLCWSHATKSGLCWSHATKSGGIRTATPGRVAQSVTCLATDASLTANPGVASSIPARSHTFVEIDHEIFSTCSSLPLNHSRRVFVSYNDLSC